MSKQYESRKKSLCLLVDSDYIGDKTVLYGITLPGLSKSVIIGGVSMDGVDDLQKSYSFKSLMEMI